MKTINFSFLLAMLFVLPFVCVSCSDDEAPLPTIALTAGETTETSISFTIATENATTCAYQVLTNGEVPTATSVLANGIKTTATSVTVNNLVQNTEYTVYAAAEGDGGEVLSSPIKMKTVASQPTVSVTAGEVTETSI